MRPRHLPQSVAVIVALAIAVAPPAHAQQAAPQPAAAANPDSVRNPCQYIPVRRQFDFWLGTWDVHPWRAPGATGPKLGTNVITLRQGGCLVHESWTAANGTTGESINWFDRNLGNWRQLWVAQPGGTLDYTKGEYRDGAMRFEGWTLGPQGQRITQRLTFFHLHADTVRQLFESSTDSGRTWTPGFDGRYIRRN